MHVTPVADAGLRRFVQNCCVLATTVLLWLDWMYIFPAEASLIWGRRFTGTTVLYLLNRYTALAERIIFISETFLPTCGSLIHADDAILALNYFAFAAFTIIRVYAVWGRDWKPLVVVIPLSMARPILFIVSFSLIAARIGPGAGHLDRKHLPLETISIAANVASEGIFLMLTWIKTYGIAREYSRLGLCSPLTTLLLRDGECFSRLLSCIASFEGVDQPTTFLRIWPYIDDAFTTCLLCRFLLDLRGVCFADDLDGDPETTLQFAGVHFSTDITDKLGASLRLSADAFDSQSDFEDGSHRGSTDVQGDPESESVAGKALQCAVAPFKGSSRILEDPRKPKLPPVCLLISSWIRQRN
ncbi:hypothetical protein C8T65DRAFT_579979 [Cerioporus squamosus]|nr:hypothetical protein C8T65DRAFT_579979 [Cerioporus squamosus]